MKIVFAGTPEFAVSSLKAANESHHVVAAVYTQPDRPAGRGRKLKPSPVKEYATTNGIPVFQPENFKTPETIDDLKSLEPDLMVVVAYGLILPTTVLEIPKFGCINVHASLLPRWRGAAPIQRAIEAGDSYSGITIMQMDAGLDTGDMLLKKEIRIDETDTAQTLHDRLANAGAEALLEVLDSIERGSLEPETQIEKDATYASKLDKNEARIDWSRPAIELSRKIRAFNPWPIANCGYHDKRLRILEAKILPSSKTSANPGEIIDINDDALSVQCGEGALGISRLQLEGGRSMTVGEFLNGHTVSIGDRLDP